MTTTSFYAQWNRNYHIIYHANGGSGATMSETIVASGQHCVISQNTYTKTGYKFSHWAELYPDGTYRDNGWTGWSGTWQWANGEYSISDYKFNLYAIWTPITYTISYNGNGNTGGSTASSTHTYDEAKNLTANGFTKTGYTFAGWATSQSGNVVHADKASVKNLSATQGATITFYAKWTINSYTLSIDPNGGYRVSDNSTAVITVTKNYKASENISERRKTGYTLTGYTLKNTASGSTTDIGGATFTFNNSTKIGVFTQGTVACTLVAQWTANNYTISYNPNGRGGLLSVVPDATYSENNMKIYYTNANHEYKLVNSSTNDPYATIASTMYLTANTTYVMHAEIYTDSGSLITSGSIQIFYGISKAYTEANSKRFSSNATYNTFTVSTTGTYNIRIDNDCNQTVRVKNFWVYPNFSSSKSVTFDSTYGTMPTLSRPGYTFNGWSKNMFNPNFTYDYASCTRNGETFTFDTGSKNSSSLAFQIQTWSNSSYLDTIIATSSTGIVSGVLNKTASIAKLRFKYNGNAADACFYYDISDLPDGKYVIQVNVTTMQMNKIVIKNVMIEQNANNKRTSYVSSSTHVSSDTKVNDPFNRTLFAEWTPNKYTVTFDPNCKGGLISSQTSDGTYSGNNMTITYTASTHEYKLVNVTSNDPFAQIGQTVYLIANKTYLMHAEVCNSSGSVIPSSSGSIQIFYAIGGAYNEGNSRHFYANTTYQTFTVPTTGTYNIRIDNDCGQTVRVQKFWIYSNFTYQKTVTYGEAYGTLPTGLQANGGSFVKWNSSSSGGSEIKSSTIVTTASNHKVYGAWSGQLTITVNSSSYYSNVRYSTSSGQSGSIANGSSVNLVNVPSTDQVTITATAIKCKLVCNGNSNNYYVYHGFRLNNDFSLSAYNETGEPKDVSATITVTVDMRSITVTGDTKTKDMCCVAEDSLISMADGTQKQIKDIKVGDKVLSYNTTTRKIEQTVVQSLTKVIRRDIVHITFADGSYIKITPDHPMFSERGWIAYSTEDGENTYPEVELEKQGTQIGDMILSLSLLFDKEIVDMKYITGETIPVYTFTVDNNHNYFAQSVLIHNGPVRPCLMICCVDGETNITMADGTTKKAKDVVVGDEVLSYNYETKQYEKTTIEETINPYREKILEITFEDGSTLKITDDHPLLSARGWICYNPELGQLAYGSYGVCDKGMQVGDKIITETGAKTIASIKVIEFEDLEMVYTFKLANGLAFIANGNIVASVRK